MTVASDGTFSLSKAAIDTLAGGALTQGAHSLLLTATDKSGIVTTRAIGFTYDATAPRVPTTILSLVDNNAPTTVGVDAEAAPGLTVTQRNALTLTVDPGSVIGEDGQPLTNAQGGISTVPPNLVRDMLPAGVLQHTFDITIQAPGAATFTTSARISFPNVFNATPGSKLYVESFDHTTGMLVINGTATVSEDGLSVMSDAGSGVRAPGYRANGTADIGVPLSDASFGPITVQTNGGTSAPYTRVLTSITATATTPANAAHASANPGQEVTLAGTGLTDQTQLLFRWRESGSGALRMSVLTPKPGSIAADGTSAILVVPTNANGAFTRQLFGASTQPLLQVVPVITGYDVSGGTLTLTGAGFLEAASTYNLAGTIITDTSTASPDVYYDDNTRVNIDEPAHGLGPLTVTTAGGTSAPFALNEMTLPYGTLRDVALDPATGALWMSGDSPLTGRIRRIDPAISLELQFFDLTNTDFGSTAFYAGGLQVTTEAFTLNATTVPAGSLLVFNGYASADFVTAVNQATGAVIAGLNLGVNYDLTSGIWSEPSLPC